MALVAGGCKHLGGKISKVIERQLSTLDTLAIIISCVLLSLY